MTRTLIAGLFGLVIASGCSGGATTPAAQTLPAPTTLELRGDAAGLTRNGFSAGASFGLEASRCCGLSAYVAYAKFGDNGKLEPEDHDATEDDGATDDDSDDSVNRVMEGGLELSIANGWMGSLGERLRFRLRAGFAGTPPMEDSLGRRGFAGSIAALFRVSDPNPPPVGSLSPEIDLVVGYATWALESERDAAGIHDDALSGGSLVFGVQLGAGFGIDLQ